MAIAPGTALHHIIRDAACTVDHRSLRSHRRGQPRFLSSTDRTVHRPVPRQAVSSPRPVFPKRTTIARAIIVAAVIASPSQRSTTRHPSSSIATASSSRSAPVHPRPPRPGKSASRSSCEVATSPIGLIDHQEINPSKRRSPRSDGRHVASRSVSGVTFISPPALLLLPPARSLLHHHSTLDTRHSTITKWASTFAAPTFTCQFQGQAKYTRPLPSYQV